MTALSLARAAAISALALALSACGSVRPARMTLPDDLAARSEAIDLPTLTTGREGAADVLGRRLQFERSGGMLALFDDFAVTQRAALRYSLGHGSGDTSAANCAVRRRTVSIGIVEWTAKPLSLFCEFTPAGVRLDVEEHRAGLGTQKISRLGRLAVGDKNLTVRSVHHIEGALFEVAHPIGYVISDLGRPVAAVEINGRRPRLYLPTRDDATRQASLHALLALVLLWDVADG